MADPFHSLFRADSRVRFGLCPDSGRMRAAGADDQIGEKASAECDRTNKEDVLSLGTSTSALARTDGARNASVGHLEGTCFYPTFEAEVLFPASASNNDYVRVAH